MKNIRVAILSMMIASTGYAIDESQGPINIFTIPTKNHKHRFVLDVLYQSCWTFSRSMMNGPLVFAAIRVGQYDLANQARRQERESILQFVEQRRQEAQQELKRWGYLV